MKSTQRVRLLAVVGSVTPPGRLRRAVAQGLEEAEAERDLLDLAEVLLPFADGRASGGDLASVLARFEAAEAVLFATPVYRGSLTGSLKNLLDLLPVEALERKPVAVLAMGATPHHFLGAERHLRDVLAFFGAHVTPVAGYLTSADFEDGEPTARARETVDRLFGELIALRPALDGTPAAPLRPLAAAT
jgi:FMN reductase